jgi:hypothetical protein
MTYIPLLNLDAIQKPFDTGIWEPYEGGYNPTIAALVV